MMKRLLVFVLIFPFIRAMENQEELNARLLSAIREDDVELVQEALVSGAEVNALCNTIIPGLTPLKCAARYGTIDIAKLLLESGAQVNGPSDKAVSSGSALQYACEYGHEEMVQLLLDNNADINAENWLGQTPLSSAAAREHYSLVKFLVQRGALVNPKARYGWNKDSCGLFKFSISGHSSPLSSAVHSYHEVMAKFLIEQGANVDHVESKKALLQLAYELGNNRMVQLLKDAGASLPDATVIPRVIHGHLLNAAHEGKLRKVGVLVLAGVDLEGVDEQCQATPLMWAASKGHTEICRLLLEAGVNPRAKDKYGKTPIDDAREENQPETVAVIEEFLRTPITLQQLCANKVREHYKEGLLSKEQVVGCCAGKYEFDRVIVSLK